MIDQLQLCELVVEGGLIDAIGLEEAIAHQARHGGDLYNVLIENGFVDEEQTITIVARALNIPCVSLRQFEADPEVASLLPGRLAAVHSAVPLGTKQRESGRQLFLAMANPIDVVAMEEIVNVTGLDVVAYLAGPLDVEDAIVRLYGADAYSVAAPVGELFEEIEGEPEGAFGPSLSQLLDLPEMNVPNQEEGEVGPGHRPSLASLNQEQLVDELIQVAAPEKSAGKKRKESGLGVSPLLTEFDGAVGAMPLGEPPEELFGVSGSKIFMAPESLSEEGRKRLAEARKARGSEIAQTRMGHFQRDRDNSTNEDSPSSSGAGNRSGLGLRPSGQSSSGGRKVPVPLELTQRSIRVLNQAYSTTAIEDVLAAADSKDLVVSLIHVLIDRGVIAEPEILRALARRYFD